MFVVSWVQKGKSMKKLSDFISTSKLFEYIKNAPVEVEEKPVEECKGKNTLLKVFAVVGVVAAVAGAAYALYRYFKPDFLEDYEEDFDDDYEDDFDAVSEAGDEE